MANSAHDPLRLIDRALASENEAWPRAEQALLEANEDGVPLEAASSHPDPVGRQMAQAALVSDADTRGALDKATAYLDAAAARFARTPAGTPPIHGIAANLSATFGPRLASALALRLVQQREMPHWRVMSTLAYLDRQRDPSVVPSLVRFAAQATVPVQQASAVRVLSGFSGSAVAASVRAERDRLAANGGSLPAPLAALSGGAGSSSSRA